MDKAYKDKLEEIFLTLPPEEQYAISWVLQNIDIIDFLAQGEAIPKNEIDKLIREALEKELFVNAIILIYKAIYDSENNS